MTSFLHEYLEAEHIGQSANMSCAAEFTTCPVSLFNLFKSYSTKEDKPAVIEDEPLTNEEDQYSEEDSLHDPTVTKMSLQDEAHYHPTSQHFEIDNTIDTAKQWIVYSQKLLGKKYLFSSIYLALRWKLQSWCDI